MRDWGEQRVEPHANSTTALLAKISHLCVLESDLEFITSNTWQVATYCNSVQMMSGETDEKNSFN